MSQQHYEPEFKQQIVRLHIEEGRTYRSLTAEYGVSKASISKWCKEFSEECQQNASKNLTAQNDLELMKETRRLREELADARKENLFLKKQRDSSQRESTRGISLLDTRVTKTLDHNRERSQEKKIMLRSFAVRSII